MGFEANRQQVFSKRIVDLPDQPDMSARDLKAYFDSSAEELRQSFNGLCDALSDFSAAAKMGYHESAGVPAQTVQGAIENVQKQVHDASVGKLPSGCVDGDNLAHGRARPLHCNREFGTDGSRYAQQYGCHPAAESGTGRTGPDLQGRDYRIALHRRWSGQP